MASLSPTRALLNFYRSRKNPNLRNDRIVDALVRHIGKADSMLDVGCGNGAVAARVAELVGAKVQGVDIVFRTERLIDITLYDGHTLPFEDDSFDYVTISDVLHHCEDPPAVLRDCARVAKKGIVIKDHFRFGPVSQQLLTWMDVFGNSDEPVLTRAKYFSFSELVEMADAAGTFVDELNWPMKVHDFPWRAVGWPELHFTAKLTRRSQSVAPSANPR